MDDINIKNEAILIQVVLCYVLAMSEQRENASTEEKREDMSIKKCIEILKKELYEIEKEGTYFYLEGVEEHPVNQLFKNLKDMDKEEYKILLKNVLLKIGAYSEVCKTISPLNTLSSMEDIEDLAYEIIYYNKSIEQLEEEDSKYAKYELGRKYYSMYMDKEAFELFVEADNMGYKKAKAKKCECLFWGYGTEKNQKVALEELEEEKNTLGFEGILILGQMYYRLAKEQEKYNFEESNENYKKAYEAFKKCEDCFADANYYLGIMHLRGEEVERSKKEALKQFEDAIKMGDTYSFEFLIKEFGHLYEWNIKKKYYVDDSLDMNMNIELFEDEPKNIDELNQHKYKISVRRALEIANKAETLKTDFYKKYWQERKEFITYLEFKDKKIDYIELNNRGYWQIQVTFGRISGRRGKEGKIWWDGFIDEETSKLLRCLIDVETGEYRYYPYN